MFWELIATFIAGLGAAGVVLSLRLVFKRLPKWLVPAAAGLGMIGFQLITEYTWFAHTSSRLPEGTAVVATTGVSAFYKPWSYYHPPVLKFIAADGEILPTNTPQVYELMLYFFERRMPVQHAKVLVDCHKKLQSEPIGHNQRFDNPSFGETVFTADLVAHVCPNQIQ